MRLPPPRRLVLAFSLVLLALVVWQTPGLWLRFEGWVQNQRDRLWQQVEQAAGQHVVYDRIAPTVLAALDFQNVRMVSDDGTTLFQAASVRLSWDWGLLFQGRFGEALRRVQIINGVLTLDARRDQDLLDHWAAFFRPTASGGVTPFGFTVEGFNISARWTDGTKTLALDRGFAVLSPTGHEWGLKYRGALSWDDRAATTAYARLSVRGELRSDVSFQNLSFRTEASTVRTTWFDLEPLALQVTVDPSSITINKVSDTTPFDLKIVWDRTADRWTVTGASEAFRPSRLVRLKVLADWAGLAEGTYTGRFSAVLGGDFGFSGRASWPAGALPAPLADQPVSVSGSVQGNPSAVRLTGFHLETDLVSAGFDGTVTGSNFLPDGTLTVERWSTGDAKVAQGTVHFSRIGEVVTFHGEDWSWGALATRGPSGWAERRPDGWGFSIEGPVDGTAEGRFSAAGTYLTAAGSLESWVTVTTLPLDAIRPEVETFVPSLGAPADLWELQTDLRFYITWDPESGATLEVPALAFRDLNRSNRNGSGSLRWEGRQLAVTLDTFSWDSFQGNFALSATLEPDGAVGGAVSGVLWSRPFELVGRWVPSDRTLAFSGKPGISAVVHQDASGVWTAQLAVEPLEILPGWTAGFSGQATLDGELWSVQADKVSVSGRYPWNQEAFSVRSRLQADATFLRLDDLVLNDSHGSWNGAAVTSWSPDFSSPWAGRLALATPATARESLTLDWVGTAVDRWHATLRASGLDVTRAGLPALNGLAGRIALVGGGEWEGSDGRWAVQASLSEARYGDSPLGFRGAFSGTSRRVSVRNLAVSVSPVRIVDGSADLDADTRTWKANLGLGLRFGAGDWESRWVANGSWSPADEPLSVRGGLVVQENRWSQRSFPDWRLDGQWGGGGWEASLGDGGVQARGTVDGAFTIKAQAPFPILGEVRGQWNAGALQLGVQGFRADISLVKDLINSKLFSVTAGTVTGDFTVGGSPSDPEVNGALLLQGLTATSSFLRQPLGPADVPVVLEGHRLRIDPVNIGPSNQTWLVSGGARLDHLLPEEYQFSIQTDALSVIPISYQYTGLSAIGGVNGLLVVKGSPLAVTLGGRLVLQDIVVTLKPSSPEETSASSLGFNADLTLVTGRKVEFLWPNETLPLVRAVAASGQSLVVKANDVASTWSVNGKLALKTGEINYLNRTFVLREGLLTFQEDQTSFDPRFAVRAEWRIRETAGTTNISLRADGTLSRFSPRFDATPYKSPEELQLLVGTTLVPTDTRAANIDTAVSVASDVGSSFLLTPFEETVKKNFGLDLFTVKTEILKKSLLSRNATQNGPLGASDYLDNTRLFFGKYIGDDLFLQGTLAFRQDGSVATQVSPKMVVEPEFQMEFQTPFFLLNWTLLPQHPETLFVTDNTVTFRWNWSY